MHPIISDGSTILFYGSDIFPTVAHIPIPWVMSYDLHPRITVKEKDLLLKRCTMNSGYYFEHDPNYQACTIDLVAKNYSMKKPVVISE